MSSLNIYSLVLVTSGAGSAILATSLILKFKGVGRYAGYLIFWAALWAICSGREIVQTNRSTTFFIICIEYLAISFFPAFWIMFILKFLKKDSILTPLNTFFLFLVPIITLLLVWTNSWHYFFYSHVRKEVIDQVTYYRFEKGPGFVFHTTYFYCCLIVGVGLLLRSLEKNNSIFAKQKKIILLATIIPWIANGFYLSGIAPHPGVDLTPFAFILSTVLISFGLLKYHLFDVLPIARERIVEALNEGVLVLDEKERIIYMNKEMKPLFEEPDTEIFGLPVYSFFPSLNQSLGADTEIEIVQNRNNSEKTFAVTISDFQDNRSVKKGRILLFKDISDRKEAEKKLREAKEEAEKAAGEKARFLSTMSHEIRTPLNAILGFTHLLLQESPREDQLEYLKVQQFSAENLIAIINDILDLSKIEAGRIVFEEMETDFNQLLRNIVSSFKPSAEKKGIELELQLPHALPRVLGDPVRISQVFTNLIGNAVKFTEKGKVSVFASIVRINNCNIRVKFEVEDTGVGIPDDKIGYIFESFTQASSDTTRKFGGTGLGLTITNHLLKLMDSEIQVESELDKGSRFFFELDLKKGSLQAYDEEVREINRDGGFKGKRVLIVDDNPMNVFLAKQFLKKWDLGFGISTNGREAVKEVQDMEYDLVLMDIQMPEMDGYEATREIRNLKESKYHNLPIIALSASAISEIRAEALNAGMTDMIAKPFTPKDLYDKISTYLN